MIFGGTTLRGNGCGFFIDIQSKDATQTGATSVRINLVAACRESTVFTDAERAALKLKLHDAASRMRPVV